MTSQDHMQAKLAQSGIPYKEIRCYGSQITVTTLSRQAAAQWVDLLGKFSRVKGCIHTYEYNKVNQNTMLNPTMHKVWRVYSTI